MESNNLFSSRLKELRIARGLTQSALGAVIGIKAQGVNDMEHNRIKTTLDKVCALADYFDVSLDYLVGRSDDPGRR
jgi:transcriptional regulator with XRE-family HTH domain